MFLISKEGVYRVECRVCDGLGRIDICPACDGRGHCTWSTTISSAGYDFLISKRTAHCDKGICSNCGGTGCLACGNTGKCPRCYGSGECPACRGNGYIPGRKGGYECLVCGGTGLVDSDAPRLPPIGRCPNCTRVWLGDQADCRFCGYKRKHCPSCGKVWVEGSQSCAECGFGKSSDEKKG